jgi:hypothetical protein
MNASFTAKQFQQATELEQALLSNLNEAYTAIDRLPDNFNGRYSIRLSD